MKKAAKMLLPLLLALKLKFAALLPFAIAAIALIAKKALIIGKIALLLAGILGVRKLFGQQQKSVTYEIVSHPHHAGHDVWSNNDYGASGNNGGGHGGGGWGRSNEDAQNLAYKAYQPHH
ncbi:hypothetical protein RUM44_001762 [Polyplax serrata]|uniref:Uncharacterized protein n=1 Tax=Polyplax serrata TaxID=468196 RepID=A0ABR1AKZ2_POLSC